MPHFIFAWIKFEGTPPEHHRFENIDEFWHRLRENFINNPRKLEWIIVE